MYNAINTEIKNPNIRKIMVLFSISLIKHVIPEYFKKCKS